MRDLINRQTAIDLLKKWSDGYSYIKIETDSAIKAFEEIPSAQPTLFGYNVEHLELIARVLRKENLSPEKVAEALTNISQIIAIVKDEFEETLRKAVDEMRCENGTDVFENGYCSYWERKNDE